MLLTCHVGAESRELLGFPDVLLGWLVLVVGQTEVGTFQVELESKIPLSRQQRLMFEHWEKNKM